MNSETISAGAMLIQDNQKTGNKMTCIPASRLLLVHVPSIYLFLLANCAGGILFIGPATVNKPPPTASPQLAKLPDSEPSMLSNSHPREVVQLDYLHAIPSTQLIYHTYRYKNENFEQDDKN